MKYINSLWVKFTQTLGIQKNETIHTETVCADSDNESAIFLISQDETKAVFNHRGNNVTVAKRGDELYYGDMYLCDMCEWEIYLSPILTSIFYDKDDQFIDELENGAGSSSEVSKPTSWVELDKVVSKYTHD